ncbi:MAG TPA: hypothetical protein VKP65_13410 [Rhodothermales bacterium]|nr:hypothetical protein [Rhodothermales bacterium]
MTTTRLRELAGTYMARLFALKAGYSSHMWKTASHRGSELTPERQPDIRKAAEEYRSQLDQVIKELGK